MKRMLSGIKPTGQLHLGNYIGALRNFVKYQDEYEMYAFIANLHCITIYQDPQTLKKNLRDCAALYLACGLDPNKAVIFQQSDVRAVSQLGWIMACNSYQGELNRQTQYKDKIAKGETGITVGLYAYPTLMASDILIYNSDYVPVGEDQKQHVELARDIAVRFNNRYGETFVVPEPMIAQVGARIMDLQDPTRKMSKSDNSDKGCIYLLDDPKRARKKIMSAVTDSIGIVQFDKENQPGVANLLQILSSLTQEPIDSIVKRFEGKGYGDFKKEVADAVEAELVKIQTEYNRILSEGILESVLKEGAEKANRTAEKTLRKVQKKIGFAPRA
ncbi:MAG: tryptophan--tRNA ligase [Erysipelotrichaceae bacterium]|nr:tryptophan--tRNA ligase [Erysipelotrichaceae bacterium]